MTPAQQQREERLRRLEHDLRHCLYVLDIGLDALKGTRENPERFDSLCAMIESDRQQATALVNELLEMARHPLASSSHGPLPAPHATNGVGAASRH